LMLAVVSIALARDARDCASNGPAANLVGACCPSACGRCGGSGCEERPGGREACCSNAVQFSGRLCATHAPPCMLAAECLRGPKAALYTPLTTPGAGVLSWPAPAPVPRIVWRTTHLAPKQVPNLLSGYTEGFAVMPPWNDTHCEAFLHEHFGRRVAASFRRFKHGAHKADLWRYAVLYMYGGVYLDIKVVARRPLAEIFNYSASAAHDRYTWYPRDTAAQSNLAQSGRARGTQPQPNQLRRLPPASPLVAARVHPGLRSHP